MKRRLAAILAADVVGYSRLMSVDEEGTLERLKAVRDDLFIPMIEAHHGRVFKTMGDGLLAEFTSAVEAVRLALRVQTAFAEHAETQTREAILQWRIGVNIGDVVIEKDDMFGDGVNIAARLEQIAQPGGLAVSRTVFEQVRGKIDVTFDDAGFRSLKNIAEPVHVYQARLTDAPDAQRSGGLFDFSEDKATTARITGGCLCGAVRFEIDQPAIDTGFCHCRICQKFTGAPVIVWTAFPHGSLRYVQGAPKAIEASPIARREFCGDCGTALSYRLLKPQPSGVFVIFTAALDHPAEFAPTSHAGVESQLPWLNIQDELPRSRCEASKTLRAAWEAAGITDPAGWKPLPSE